MDRVEPIELGIIQRTIESNFPQLSIEELKMLGEGWMSRVYLVNGEWIFRFPKTQEGALDLEKELRILPELMPRITLSIPEFKFIGQQGNGLAFVGYKILPGELLDEESFASLPDTAKENLAQQIAQFINEISSFPKREARLLNIPESNPYQDYSDVYAEIREELFPLIDGEVRQYITSRFESYLGNPNNFSYEPSLIHADLSPNHFLYHAEQQRLTGIIDFGDLEIGDPDYEYIYLLEDCGRSFTRRVMELRNVDNIKVKLEKVSFFVTADHMDTALEGLRRNDRDWVDQSIDALKTEIQSR